jgi:hypothetical protein
MDIYTEDGGDTFLQKVGIHLQDDISVQKTTINVIKLKHQYSRKTMRGKTIKQKNKHEVLGRTNLPAIPT